MPDAIVVAGLLEWAIWFMLIYITDALLDLVF